MMLMPVARRNSSKVASGRCSPAETQALEAREIVPRRQRGQRAIGQGRGEERAHPVALDRGGELGRPGTFEEQGRGAAAQRKEQHAAEPEGEGQRGAAGEEIVFRGMERRARERIADRQHVAVEMHRPLGLAGCAGGEGDERHVVARRDEIGEGVALPRHQRLEPLSRIGVERDDPAQRRRRRSRRLELARQRRVAQREFHLRLGDDEGEFARAQERHGGDGDAAGLQHAKPAHRQHRRIGGAQQHAVAGSQPQFAHQHLGDAVGAREHLVVAPRAIGRQQAATRPAPRRDGAVQQLDRGIDTFGIGELRQAAGVDDRPRFRRWQALARKPVLIGARQQQFVLPARDGTLSEARRDSKPSPRATSGRQG